MKINSAQIRVAPASGGCELFHSMFSVGCSMFDVFPISKHRTLNIEHPTSNKPYRTRQRQVLPES
jgi:hypothetical protein